MASNKFDEEEPVKEESRYQKYLCLNIRTWFLVPFLLFLSAFGMMLGAFGAPRWTSYRSPEHNYQYSLDLCTDGDGDVAREGTSWSCLKKWNCDPTGRSGMCILAQDLVYAFKSYWILEFLALLWILMLMVRVFAMYRGRDHGPNWIVYLLLVGVVATHCAAIMSWFALTMANFQDDCTVDINKPYNRPNVCAEEGAKLSIAIIFVLFGTSILTLVLMHKNQEKQTDVRLERGKLGCLSYVLWLILADILMLFGLWLVIASAAVKDWVTTDDKDGNLFTLNKWEGLDDLGYECISEPICNADNWFGACETFRAIKRASFAYTLFIVAVFFSWTLWKDGWLMLLLKRDFSFPIFYLILPHLTWFLQLTGMVVWFGVSQANFYTNCDTENKGLKWSICAHTGPILAICGTIVLFLAALLFTYVFIMRKKLKYQPRELELVPQSDRALSSEQAGAPGESP